MNRVVSDVWCCAPHGLRIGHYRLTIVFDDEGYREVPAAGVVAALVEDAGTRGHVAQEGVNSSVTFGALDGERHAQRDRERAPDDGG